MVYFSRGFLEAATSASVNLFLSVMDAFGQCIWLNLQSRTAHSFGAG